MKGLTPTRIQDVWRRHPIRLIDTFGSNATIVAQVVDPVEQAEQSARICAWISQQSADLGGFVEKFGYEWALYADAYEFASEAAWQARIFQQLSSLWLDSKPYFPAILPRVRLSSANFTNVVVRQTLVTSYGLMSPSYRPFEDVHFLIFPQSFFDFAFLIWRSFAHWCRHNRQNNKHGREEYSRWSDVTSPGEESKVGGEADPFLLEAIARDLAQPAKDVNVNLPDAAGVIADQVPFFARAARMLGPEQLTDFNAHVFYVLADFALAHELGHRIAGHVSGPRSGADELVADQLAYELFLKSGGWRAEILANSPLTDHSAPLFGSVVFHQTIRLRSVLQEAVAGRLSEQYHDMPKRPRIWDEVEQQRAAQSTAMYIGFLRQQNKSNFDDVRIIANISSNLSTYLRHVEAIIRSVPQTELAQAYKIAFGYT